MPATESYTDVATLVRDDRATLGRARRRWVGLVVVAAALVVVGVLVLRGGDDAGARLSYVTLEAARRNLTVLVTATGYVQPTRQVAVSSELSGTVRAVYVDYNSPVGAGQVLAELDTDKLKAAVQNSQAKLAAARAQVQEALATVAQARAELARKRSLAERSLVSAQDLDLAQAAYDRAQAAHASSLAGVDVAHADLRLNETHLSKATIRSPIGGVVLERNIDPGQTVAASLQAPVLFVVAEDLRQMELQVDVDEADVGQVAADQSAAFGVDAYPERQFPARIREVRYGSETRQGVVTYKAILDIDNSGLLLRPGMTATAQIVVRHVADALTVPNAALRFTPAASSEAASTGGLLQKLVPRMPPRSATPKPSAGADRVVWLLRDGQPVAVAAKVGVSDGSYTEVVEGALAAGDAVIVGTASGKR